MISLLLSLSLASAATPAQPVTVVDAGAPSNPCRAFGHNEVLVDPKTGVWTPRTDCIGNKSVQVLTQANVDTTYANAAKAKADAELQMAFNQQKLTDAQVAALTYQKNLEAKALLDCVNKVGTANPNLRCKSGDLTVESRTDAVGVADADNRFPTNYGYGYGSGGYGNYAVGTGNETADAINLMNGYRAAGSQPSGSTKSTGGTSQPAADDKKPTHNNAGFQ